MSDPDSRINVEVSIPKSGIILLGGCIRYISKISHPDHELLPIEKELLDGKINIDIIINSYATTLKDKHYTELLIDKLDEVTAENEELSLHNQQLLDTIDEYRTMEMMDIDEFTD